jgi:NAD(P)-dependent dehydrogenase (short-subunit alcohol dehydrogenase family)
VLVADRLSRGDRVVSIGSRPESLSALVEIHPDEARRGRLVTFDCDLTMPDASTKVADFCRVKGILPDGLVNNARNSSYLKTGNAGLVCRENFIGELTLDVVVPYELTMALAQVSGSRLARVVNIGSQYGVVAPNRTLYENFDRESAISYGVAKAALTHLSRELAVRLAPRGIQVNCVSFGGVEGRVDAAFQRRYAQLAPSGRMLREDEVAGPIAFLLSDASSGMTGHNLVVDGGWTAW